MFTGEKAMRGVALRSSRGFLSFASALVPPADAGAARATAITAARAARVMALSTAGALPLYSRRAGTDKIGLHVSVATGPERRRKGKADRKSTRLNSSHTVISYAVFCLKKK